MHLSRRRSTVMCAVVAVLVGGGLVTYSRLSAQAPAADAAVAAPTPRVFFDTYCITCHNQKLKTAGLMLDTLDLSQAGRTRRNAGEGDREAAGRFDAAAGNAARQRGHL